MEGDWSCYGGGQFKGGRMVMLQRWSLMDGEWVSYGGLVEGEWLCYRGDHFNGGKMVRLQVGSYWKENSHLTGWPV